jgi:spore germination protein KB
MDLSNIQPILVHDVGAISSGALDTVSFPFAETVMFLGIADAIKTSDSPRRIFLWGIGIGALISLIILLRNIAILGVPLMTAEYYPSYIGARIINISDVVTRTEGTIWTNYVLTVFTKGTLCLLAASKGAASLFGVKDYKKMVLPLSLLGLALSAILFKSTMELFAFHKLYPYYALPFEAAIPVLIWVTAEIKNKRKKPKNIPVQS